MNAPSRRPRLPLRSLEGTLLALAIVAAAAQEAARYADHYGPSMGALRSLADAQAYAAARWDLDHLPTGSPRHPEGGGNPETWALFVEVLFTATQPEGAS